MEVRSNNTLYIGFSRSTGGPLSRALGWLIRKFTGGTVNHAFFLYFDENVGVWMTLGANANGVTLIPLDEFRKDREIAHLYKPVAGSLWDGVHALHEAIGIGYDFSGLLGMAGVELLRRLGVTRPVNWLDNPHRLFCSEYCAQVLIYTTTLPDADFRAHLRRMRPDTIDPAMLDALIAESGIFAPALGDLP
jgi:hypothetical protein